MEPGYEYLNEEELPVLLLGIVEKEYNFRKYNFNKKRKWRKIAHQTAGVSCHQHYIVGTILTPRKNIKRKLLAICDMWLDTNCSKHPSLDEILTYRAQLKNLLGVDCNYTYMDFEEAIYPIDCSRETIRKLAIDNLPVNLDNLINWNKNELSKYAHWRLYILGENSD